MNSRVAELLQKAQDSVNSYYRVGPELSAEDYMANADEIRKFLIEMGVPKYAAAGAHNLGCLELATFLLDEEKLKQFQKKLKLLAML